MWNENLLSKTDLYIGIYLTLITSKNFIEFNNEKIFISKAEDLTGRSFQFTW